MINLFQFAPNDQSLVYLQQLFGSMNGIIPSPPQANQISGGSLSLLGTMFQTFNSVILAVGALIVVYTTVVGVMLTAHEGEFMGKKWSNLWIPIRIVIGIAALVPTGSGYSGIQIVMMWVIVQGIGAADTLWNTVLSYINIAGSPYAQVNIPSVGVNQALEQIFQSITCQVSAKMAYANPYDSTGSKAKSGGYFCHDNPSKAFCSGFAELFPGKNNTSSLGPEGACGSFSYCDKQASCAGQKSNSLECISCTAQITALGSIVPTLRGIAQQLADADYAYQQYYYSSLVPPTTGTGQGTGNKPKAPEWVQAYCSSRGLSSCDARTLPAPGAGMPNPPTALVNDVYWPFALQPKLGSGSFISTVTSYYLNTVTGAVNTYIQQQAQNQNNLTNPILKQAQATGWIFAGAYYYSISQLSGNNLTKSIPAFTAKTPEPQVGNQNNLVSSYRNNYTAANDLVSAAAGAAGSSPISAAAPQIGGMSTALHGAMSSVRNSFTTTISGSTGTNPLAALVMWGQALLAIAEALFAAFLIITIIATSLGYLDVFVLGSGVDNPVGPGITTLYFILVPALLALLGILISIGGTLAIYIPLIPYTIFTFGAIAWLISTIETMVAGPLVALGILSPSGQHELLGKSEPALMLIFYVFLRPSLMIFGLMSAMLLALVILNMINAAFANVIFSITSNDPIELILFLVAYVFLILTSLNKCFAAIYIIPQRVMDWIGGHAREGGEAEGLGEVKGGVSAGAGAAAGAGQFTGGQAQKGVEAQRKAGVEFAKGQSALTFTSKKTPPPPP